MNRHKVIWQEGMLLRPQHLQHNDRYYDHQLKTRTRLLGPHFWGFTQVEIDPQFLRIGQIVVNRAAGVLPDGSLFDSEGSRQPLMLEVPANSGPMPVYLALPLVTGNHIEARAAGQEEVLARYCSYEVQVMDSNAGAQTRSSILCAQPDLHLLPGESGNDQAWVKLPLCQVQGSNADRVISLDPEFMPTVIEVQSSEFLSACLREVIALLGNRGHCLAERIRSNGKVGGAEVGEFIMLQMINRTELLLRHYQEQAGLHPEQLYRLLLEVLGELTTFSSGSRRPEFVPAYRHGDQGGSFRVLMVKVRQLLSMVLEQHAIELSLEPRHYGILVSPLVDSELIGSATFVIAASAGCGREQLRQRLPAHLKVGTVEGIRDLVNLHLPGIRVTPLPVAPRQIPFDSSQTYFSLEPNAQELAQLARSGGFAFHPSGELGELELHFWAIRS